MDNHFNHRIINTPKQLLLCRVNFACSWYLRVELCILPGNFSKFFRFSYDSTSLWDSWDRHIPVYKNFCKNGFKILVEILLLLRDKYSPGFLTAIVLLDCSLPAVWVANLGGCRTHQVHVDLVGGQSLVVAWLVCFL